jgi:metal-dependent hydrolase (beta-lactamase superfamily II)
MRRFTIWLAAVLVLLVVAGLTLLELRQRRGIRRAEAQFATYLPRRMSDFGVTETLTILPLVDFHTAAPELRGEVGLSYLIETDEHRILFDVGYNAGRESPSPLEHNMRALGVELGSIDTVFISHNHLDHVGGLRNQMAGTFSLGLQQQPLPHPGARAFVPTPMHYPGSSPIHADEPMRVGEGVASTGTIGRHLVIGWIDEQSLVVNVEGRGGVIIVGCGHQPIPNLLRRYDQAFSAPLYGIVGGLHLPVPSGRIRLLGLDPQRILASGDGIFAALTMADVKEQLAELEARELGLIGVGGHDSSDEVIAMLGETFGDRFRHVRVGEAIVIGQ